MLTFVFPRALESRQGLVHALLVGLWADIFVQACGVLDINTR